MPPPPDSPTTRTGELPAAVTPVPSGTLDRLALPGPRMVIFIIMLARTGLIVALGLGAITDATASLIGFPILFAMLSIATLALGWLGWSFSIERQPGADALMLQFLVDVMLVSGLIAFTRGSTTPLAALYIAVVAGYALLLPVGRGLTAAFVAAACYVIVTLVLATEPPGAGFWSQVLVIALVGAMIAVLGHRLAAVAAEQRSLAQALAQARMEAEEILATIQSGVITIDGAGRLAYINPRARRILGGSGFISGQPVLETLRARSRELHDAIARGIEDGSRVSRLEAAVRRFDGSLFPVGVSTTTFHRPGSEHPSVTAIFTDISDLKRLQEFRLRAERLEAVAALSASLAHEIRNPLMAIRSAVEQLAAKVHDDPDDTILARLVMRESERLNRLLSEFLDFSRVRATQYERTDLLQLVNESLSLLSSHPALNGVSVEVFGDPVEMDADRDLVHRVASNLVLNAAQALNGDGHVTVTIGLTEPDQVDLDADRRVQLVVSDDGPGIPESVKERLFEPFVVGRPGGTGLGLAIVQRAVHSHRGVILVDSRPGTGTTFTILFPISGTTEASA